MSNLLRALVVLPLWLPLCTQAHMQMSWPYALRSPLDPAVSEQYKDYSITNPLKPDGSDFTCKHYQYNDTNPQAYDIKATYQAGNTYNITLAGGATHSGGSCQISISYDNGATFKVLQSIIGGCPLAYTYDFTVPSFAPSSDSALLSWSWFNLVGNREMYQNCARVQIQGAPVQRYRRTAYRRQTSLDQLPDVFACNVGNGCTTTENSELVFPNPGANVIYGQDAVTPNPGPGFVIAGSNSTSTTSMATTTTAPFPAFNTTSFYGPTGTGHTNQSTLTISSSYSVTTLFVTTTSTPMFNISSTTSSTTPMSTATTTPQQFDPITVTITVTVTPVLSTPSTTSSSSTATTLVARDTTSISGTMFTTVTVTASSTPPATSTALPSSCTPGQFACNSITSFSQCVSSGTYVFMGNVAAGMQCVNGQIIRQNAGPCTPNGQIFCNGNNAFYMCDQGGLIDMGPVAAGTVCQNGVIVAA